MARNQALDVLDDPREERFVALYVENPNATQAAIAAGYAPKSAHVTASRLLNRAKIKEAIARRNAKFLQRYEATPDRIIKEFAKIAFANMADVTTIDDDGTIDFDFSRATRHQLASLGALEVERTEHGPKTKFKLYDKQKALTELARLAALYPAERLEHTGANGGPIATANLNVSKIDIEALDPEQRAQLRQTLLMLKQSTRQSED